MGVNEEGAASDQLFNRNEARHLSSFSHPGGFAPEPRPACIFYCGQLGRTERYKPQKLNFSSNRES